MGGFAWVTLATNDSYSLGALVLAHSLKQAGTKQELAVLVTPGVTNAMRAKLATVFNIVKEVNILDSKDETNLRLLKRPELGITFTKLHCWRLTQYDKCVFLDADTLVLQNCDELFDREELSAAPDVGWPDCFNSGVFVYRPSNETFEKLITFALERGSFDGGDQGLLNLYFSEWAHKDIAKHLPFIYNMCSTACYSYLPAFKQFGRNAKIIHFIGTTKPWLQYFNTETRQVQPSGEASHLTDVLQLWWNIFCSLIHPQLSPDMSQNRRVSDNGNSHGSASSVSYNSSHPITNSHLTHNHSHNHNTSHIHHEVGPHNPADDYQNVWDPWDEYDLKHSQPIEPHNTNAHSNAEHANHSNIISYSETNKHNESHDEQEHINEPSTSTYKTDCVDAPIVNLINDNNTFQPIQHFNHHSENDYIPQRQIVHTPRNTFSSHHYSENVCIPQPEIVHIPSNNQPQIVHTPSNNQPQIVQIPSNNQPEIVQIPSNNQPEIVHIPSTNYTEEHSQRCETQIGIHDHSETFDHITISQDTHTTSKEVPHYIPDTVEHSNIIAYDPIPEPILSQECEATTTMPNDTPLSSISRTDDVPISEDSAGLAGAFAQLTLGVARSPEQQALDDLLRKQAWEVGNIDYLGRDSFDNIWSKISETLSQGEEKDKKDDVATAAAEEKVLPEKPAEIQVETAPVTEALSPQVEPVKESSEKLAPIVCQKPVTESAKPEPELVCPRPVAAAEKIEEPQAKSVDIPQESTAPKVAAAEAPKEQTAEPVKEQPLPVAEPAKEKSELVSLEPVEAAKEQSAPVAADPAKQVSEPVMTETIKEQPPPLATESVKEQAAPVSTESVTEQSAPAATQSVTEQSAPVATESVTEQSAPVPTESVTEQSAPVATDSVKEQIAPAATELVKETSGTDLTKEQIPEVPVEAAKVASVPVEPEVVPVAEKPVQTQTVAPVLEQAAPVQTEPAKEESKPEPVEPVKEQTLVEPVKVIEEPVSQAELPAAVPEPAKDVSAPVSAEPIKEQPQTAAVVTETAPAKVAEPVQKTETPEFTKPTKSSKSKKSEAKKPETQVTEPTPPTTPLVDPQVQQVKEALQVETSIPETPPPTSPPAAGATSTPTPPPRKGSGSSKKPSGKSKK